MQHSRSTKLLIPDAVEPFLESKKGKAKEKSFQCGWYGFVTHTSRTGMNEVLEPSGVTVTRVTRPEVVPRSTAKTFMKS